MFTFSRFAELKRFFLSCFVGALIVSAVAGVIAVLVGEFNEITARVFMTLFTVVLHSLISLLFIWDDSRRKTFDTLVFFTNVVFLIIVVSFVASIFLIWKVISEESIFKVYQMCTYIGIAALHADLLSKALKKEKYLDNIVYANFVFIVMVLLMLLPITFMNNADVLLGSFFYRLLAAIGIVDGTLTVLTMIFYKLYMHNHPQEVDVILGSPEASSLPARRGMSLWVTILFFGLVYQIVRMLLALTWRAL